MRRSRVLPFVMAATVVTACSGSDGTSSTSEDDVTTTAVPDPTTTPTSSSTTESTTSATEPGAPSTIASTAPVVDVTDAEPWLVELTDPTGPLLDSWADRPVFEPAATDVPDGVETQLAWIYEHLIRLWRDDLRLPTIAMSDVAFDEVHRETAPGATIDIVGAGASMLADSYATIAALAERAADPGSPAEPMFATWADHGWVWTATLEAARSGLAQARDLDAPDQSCFLATLDRDDDCEGPGGAIAVEILAELDGWYEAIDAVDIDDPATYAAFGLDFDECRAWDDAVAATGLTADEELRIWLALDDHDLDVHFVSLSECGWVSDREEDAVADDVADEQTFLDYLTAVADAIVASGYDPMVAEMADGAEDETRYYESVSAEATGLILTSARDAASRLWSTASSPAFATKLYVVSGIEIVDWVELDDRELDWDDLGSRLCDGWAQVVEQYSADEFEAIAAAVDDLGLDGTLVPASCG